ncbi:uncharacterized protein (DUF1015 family) [Chthoniobacter flavus]|nr:DUF1015 family protein [Chthoniobacter flavus]TCO95501.1 uncharacterized protein (DUF1015 family) [Chthoniobacter flavus]
MLRIKAFQGLRPTPPLVAEVACVPYDVVDREESAALAAGHPQSLLHVDRAEIDLPPETDPYSAAVYEKARQNFLGLQDEGALIRETEPCIYLYQQRMGKHVQVGVATVCHIEDYENDIIKKHEKTRRDKEDDRTRLIGTLSADTGPVFLTYRDSAAIDQLVAAVQKDAPLYDFTAPDGIQHTVWRVPGAKAFVDAFAQVPVSYVADGHHRTASAVRVGRERREANPAHTGNEEYNWFLAVLFPASQLQILPYNRAVKDLNGHSKEAFLEAVGRTFKLVPNGSPTPLRPGEVRMYLDQQWYDLAWQPAADADPISQLDVTGLQDRLLAPLLGIDDPRTSKRIDFIGGIRGTDELVKLVDSGKAAVAFSMYPTTVEQLMAIADANQIMPPKSTWFEPKLRSGLFIHTF